MFSIGEKVFYPNHGAGVITSIEEKEFLGETHLYYVLDMLLRELHIMVPVAKVARLGIRHIVDLDLMENLLTIFNDGEPDPTINASQRQRLNMEKMKSGNIYEGAEVIRDLTCISKKRVLGAGDKMMLDNAQQLFISELALVKGLEKEQASQLFKRVMHN
ncbi:UNVERIFIED_CONTAM: CarD family transcriptional regulator [Brevibacillus sp. OAP136]